MIDLISMNVLIVDDQINMCKSIRGMLKFLNFSKNTVYAHDGLKAWNILNSEEIDMVILAWRLPVLSGVELLDKIRDDKRLRYMPVVMTSGEVNQGIVAEAGESEIDAFLIKPFTAKDLGEKIMMVLNRANDPPLLTRLLRKSKESAEDGDLVTAFKVSMEAVQADPKSSRPIRELGILFFNKGEFDSAEKCFVRAIKLNDMDVVSFHYLGEIYLEKKNFKVSEKFFSRAMDISPRHVSRAVTFGKILVKEKMFTKALKIFNSSIKLSGNTYVLKEEIADYCYEYKLNQFALKQYEFLLARMPERIDLHKKVGILKNRTGAHMSALSHMQAAEKHDKDDIGIKLEIADILIKLDQSFRADSMLREILKTDPGNKRAKQLVSMCV